MPVDQVFGIAHCK